MRTVKLLDEHWHFKQAGHGDETYLPVAQFPTNVHLDLLHHGLIPDPRLLKNETYVQWVGEKAWIYRTTFGTPDMPRGSKAVLAFDGLDTFASVDLNGEAILATDNMFIPERVEVTALLRTDGSDNELVIYFDTAFFRGWARVDHRPGHKWKCWNGDSSRLAVRKAQYHWGWDWGPTLLTCGPWRPISLEVYSSRLEDLDVDVVVDVNLKSAEVGIRAKVEGNAAAVRFTVFLHGVAMANTNSPVSDGEASTTFKILRPELWFPARHGKQTLYKIQAALLDDENDRDSQDSISKRIGIRRAELVQQQLEGEPGTSFFFRINNIPIFCGGSNWIPADSFIPRISPRCYQDWVRLAADGNQVMLRVWGGGIYEEQAFYDACDEAGILVWQDFMFSCGNYPAYPAALESITREARANILALRHHPCIVIWSGNNEDYQVAESEGLGYNPDDENRNNWLTSDFPARYIYEYVLPSLCAELIPSCNYHPGSPWGGSKTTDATVGDIHQWNVWHGSQDMYQDFDRLVGRFVSEFGMEAFPSIKTVDQGFLAGDGSSLDRYPQSLTADAHNKAAGGLRRLATYLVENIQFLSDPIEYYIYCTQLIQAECLSTALRLWKRKWCGPGREYCGGALVWQMNDCWPVTSWSMCDYYLRPKHAYYAVKREMKLLTVGMVRKRCTVSRGRRHSRVDVERKATIHVWACNLTQNQCAVGCVIAAWDVETGREVFCKTVVKSISLPPNRSTEVHFQDFPSNIDLEGRTVVAAYLVNGSGERVARFVNWPEPLRHLHLQKPRRLHVELAENCSELVVRAEVPVKGLAVESKDDGVRFDDNLVDVVPGETMRIGVRGATKSTSFMARYLGMLA